MRPRSSSTQGGWVGCGGGSRRRRVSPCPPGGRPQGAGKGRPTASSGSPLALADGSDGRAAGRTGRPMREHMVFGTGWIEAELPDDTVVVPPGLSLPLPATPDLHAEVRNALRQPRGSPPLAELARGAKRVTVAFDDPTVPCYAPLWPVALPIVVDELERGGNDPGRNRGGRENALSPP